MPRAQSASLINRLTLPAACASARNCGAAASTSASSGATSQLVMQASARGSSAISAALSAGSSPGWWITSAKVFSSRHAASEKMRA
ncbi:MAG: hypothetical protein IPM07_22005 [Anaerolineales bacterium]|nr:hypothetical protein [Anaerolineales bacterium]